MTRFESVEGKVFFVEEQHWKMHRTVDAKLEIALHVNDNEKVNLVSQMKRMNRYLIKLLFLSAVIYFKNVNTKHILTQFHSAPVQKIFITAFCY